MTNPIAYAITRPGKEPLLFKDKAKAETMRASLNDATAEVVDLVATTGLSTLPATFNADVQINALELLNRCIADLEIGFVVCKRCGDQEDTATLDVMDGLRKLRGMLTDTEAAHAKNDHLDAELVIAADNALRYIASATGLTMQYEPLNAPFSASMLASALVKYKNKEGQEADEKTVSAIVAAETAQAAQAPDPSDEMKNSSLLLHAATDICMQTGESVSDFAKWLADGGMIELVTAHTESMLSKKDVRHADPVNKQILDALKIMVEQFTKSPSTLKDTMARNSAHRAIAAAESQKQADQVAHDRPQSVFKTSKSGREYVADFFANSLLRHDFSGYINDRLAGDFACALADGLNSMKKKLDLLLGTLEEIERYNTPLPHGLCEQARAAISAVKGGSV